jgi:hypothetical protein
VEAAGPVVEPVEEAVVELDGPKIPPVAFDVEQDAPA